MMCSFFTWKDSLLEHGVVCSDWKLGCHLNVVIQRPEVLDCGHGDDGPLVFLPRSGFVVFEEPKGPGIL